METFSFSDFIKIDEYLAMPKYKQLANAILNAIEAGIIQQDYMLPSINELSFKYDISRDTIQKGYRYLKKMGAIKSFPGKGYFINDTCFGKKVNISMSFDKYRNNKKMIYDALITALGEDVTIDFYVHSNDSPSFKSSIRNAREVINTIPKDKLLPPYRSIIDIEEGSSLVFVYLEKDSYDSLPI